MPGNSAAAAGGCADIPHIGGAVSFLYYHDVRAAIAWYEQKLGLPKVFDDGWVAVFAVGRGSHIGLVNGTDGSQKPTGDSNKGVLIAIETQDLESWFERLSGLPDVPMLHGIHVGAKGKTDVFNILDPGGYIVEFFRWRDLPSAWPEPPVP